MFLCCSHTHVSRHSNRFNHPHTEYWNILLEKMFIVEMVFMTKLSPRLQTRTMWTYGSNCFPEFIAKANGYDERFFITNEKFVQDITVIAFSYILTYFNIRSVPSICFTFVGLFFDLLENGSHYCYWFLIFLQTFNP